MSIFELHKGPSSALRQNPVYSPHDLHPHVFSIVTDLGAFDLLAYNEVTYAVWVREIAKIARGTSQIKPPDDSGRVGGVERSLAPKRARGQGSAAWKEDKDPSLTPSPDASKTDHLNVSHSPHTESALCAVEVVAAHPPASSRKQTWGTVAGKGPSGWGNKVSPWIPAQAVPEDNLVIDDII